MSEAIKRYQRSPKGKYATQKGNAKRRKIPWELSFDQWWDIWQKSGHWDDRGTSGDSYVMSRILDAGPYSVDNVQIITSRINSSESFENGMKYYTSKYRKKHSEKAAQKARKEVENHWPLNWATEDAKKNNPFLTGEPYVSRGPMLWEEKKYIHIVEKL